MVYTFVEYAERRDRVNTLLESVAYEAANNPVLNELLSEEGFWKNLGNAAAGLWKGIKQGVTTGAAVAHSQMTGPATQLGYAITALEKALKAIQADANWKNSQTTGQDGKYPSMNLGVWLQDTIKELQNQQPQFANKQNPTDAAAGPQTAAAQPAPGVVPGAAPSKGV